MGRDPAVIFCIGLPRPLPYERIPLHLFPTLPLLACSPEWTAFPLQRWGGDGGRGGLCGWDASSSEWQMGAATYWNQINSAQVSLLLITNHGHEQEIPPLCGHHCGLFTQWCFHLGGAWLPVCLAAGGTDLANEPEIHRISMNDAL